MELLIHAVDEKQLPLFEELTKVLGLRMEKKKAVGSTDHNRIDEAIKRIEDGTAELIEVDINELKRLAYA